MLNNVSNSILQCSIKSITAKRSDTGGGTINIVAHVLKQFACLSLDNLGGLLIATVQSKIYKFVGVVKD